MPKVEIYYTRSCPYCVRALALLKQLGVKFIGADVSDDDAARREMARRAADNSLVPQIFIDGKLIGGSDKLLALHQNGELAKLLAGQNGAKVPRN